MFKYPNKDKFIKVYEIIQKTRPNDENTYIEKRYIHPKKSPLRAYVRQLSASERITKSTETEMNTYEVVINYRKGIKRGQFIEFKDMTLKINGVDGYEQYDAELKLTASSAITPEYYDQESEPKVQNDGNPSA